VTEPAALLERLRGLARASLARVLKRREEAERRWRHLFGEQARAVDRPPRAGAVLTYAELLREASARLGDERTSALLAEEETRLPATLDARERSLHLVQCLWTASGRSGPAVVLYYSPPYYPHVAARPCPLHTAVAAVAQAHPELNLRVEEFYPYISDMSYLRLEPGVDIQALTANMPLWRDAAAAPRVGSYSLPLEAIQALDMPFVDLGPFGGGVHQRGEWVLASYSFGIVPQLVYEVILRLATGGDKSSTAGQDDA